MGKVYTGIEGSLFVDGQKVGKVRKWTFDGDAEALETTTLGDYAPTYRYGRQSYAGSCTLYYYRNKTGVIEGKTLFGALLRTGRIDPDQKYRLRLVAADRSVEFDALITSFGIGAEQGDVMSADVSFVVSGPLIEASMGSS
jgi:hypothetical protein